MRTTKRIGGAMVLLIAAAWVVATPVDVRAANLIETRPVHVEDPTCLSPDSVVGVLATIENLSPSPKVRVTLRLEDPANPGPRTSQIFWVCTTIQNGCHADSCGFVDIGTIAQNAAGNGSKTITLAAGNPFPGCFVHIDMCPGDEFGCTGGPLYASTYEGLFQPPGDDCAPDGNTAAKATSGGGDPSR